MAAEPSNANGICLLIRIIDCVYGRPAVGVSARVITDYQGVVEEHIRCVSDPTGRIKLELEEKPTSRPFRMDFDINGYFAALGVTPFYPKISINFRMPVHIPRYELIVLITPSSYSVLKEE